MNTVKDLRKALAQDVRRLQPPAGLETRVLYQALGGPVTHPSHGPVRGRLIGALAAVLVVVLAATAIVLGGRILRDWGTSPAGPSTHAVPRAETGMVTSSIGWRTNTGPIERTTDGGAHWTNVDPLLYVDTASPEGVYFLDGDHAWAAASDANGLTLAMYRTVDGGNTWTRGTDITVNAARCTGCLQPRLYFLDPTHGWLLVRLVTIGGPANMVQDAMYRTSDGGLHWVPVATNLAHDEYADGCEWIDASFASPQTGWLAQSCAATPLLRTEDGGATWSPQALPFAAAGLTCPCEVDAPKIFDRSHATLLATGRGGPSVQSRLFTTSDGGAGWSVRALPGESQFLVGFFDANHGWAVAGPSSYWTKSAGNPSGIVPGVNVPLYRTDDGGRTWVAIKTNLPLSDNNGRVTDLYFVDPEHGFAERYNTTTIGREYRQFLRTDDGGLTWKVVWTYA